MSLLGYQNIYLKLRAELRNLSIENSYKINVQMIYKDNLKELEGFHLTYLIEKQCSEIREYLLNPKKVYLLKYHYPFQTFSNLTSIYIQMIYLCMGRQLKVAYQKKYKLLGLRKSQDISNSLIILSRAKILLYLIMMSLSLKANNQKYQNTSNNNNLLALLLLSKGSEKVLTF